MGVYETFCIGIVFYNPTQEEVERVKDYSQIVSRYYIYDNTENNKSKFISNVKNYDKCVYISNNVNHGIAKALNHMCKAAIQDGFKYILLLDQDSIFDLQNIKKLFDGIKKCQTEDIGVFAPESRPIKKFKDHFNKYENNKADTDSLFKEVQWKITSGSVIDLEVFNKVNGFDENLFIDKVDFDYCISIKKRGYKTVIVQNSFLYQFLGEQRGGFFNLSEHNYIRHYYLFRNRLYLVKKYKEDYKGIRGSIFVILSVSRHITSVLLFESKKIKKIKAMKVAFYDYRNNKMGKYHDSI